jgi:hypothetical protein
VKVSRERSENVPFFEGAPKEGQHDLVLSAEGPNGTNVLLGTVAAESKEAQEVKSENVVVKDEKAVKDGKVQPGNGQLRKFLGCTAAGCLAGGLRCLVGGPTWPVCFCMGCGIGAVQCGLTILFSQ